MSTSGTKTVARCGIYEERPQLCQDYPKLEHWMPPECTFTFPGGKDSPREGSCSCDVGACCNVPREGGEPEGLPLDEEAGGEPCKHLTWVEEPLTKEASDLNEVHADGSAEGVRSLLRVIQG